MTFRGSSIAFAIGRDLVLAVVACAAVLLLSLSIQLTVTERELREEALQRAARHVERNLRVDAGGATRLAAAPGSSWASFGYPLVIFDRDGRPVIERMPGPQPGGTDILYRQGVAALRDSRGPGSIGFFRLEIGGSRISGAALRTGGGADERLIAVFKDESAEDALLDDLVREFPYRRAWVQLSVLGMLLLAGGFIVARRMRPLAEASRIAGAIGPRTLALRLPARDLPSEVVPIVEAVNGALDRLDRAAAMQREFLRRAAHQLRTPLAVLSARAESLDDRETARELRSDVRELARIVSQFQHLNEVEGLPDRGEAVAEFGAVGETVRADLAARAARADIRITLAEPPGPVLVRGDRRLIEIAVRNLVENALQHSPGGSTVAITVRADGRIEVGDSGPGVPAELRDQIFAPFWSGDPDGARAGLGLTIVRSVAERFGGEVTVEAAAGGGALFSLRLPLAPYAAEHAGCPEATIGGSAATIGEAGGFGARPGAARATAPADPPAHRGAFAAAARAASSASIVNGFSRNGRS